ncbi:hypothetical protein [Adlercreutzia murintestinalis]|uniref:hypothetical protein n=1 Tax=Adlercreutzia murintestinalis TaxID=2941325 RepID=UPI00203CA0A9|nr:hypothetical protein [Adlercreutzia murintestinalis]
MKKSSLKKTLLTSTMAFALAVGTAVPAFAAPLDNGDQGSIIGDQATADNLENQYTDQEYVPADGQTSITGAKTEVGVFSRLGQIKVSVPTKVALALTAAGGPISGPDPRTTASTTDQVADDTTPAVLRSGSGYGIENLGGMPVKVSKVDAAVDAKFGLLTSAATSSTAAPTGKTAGLALSLTPVANTAEGTSGAAITNLKATQNVTWTIGRATEQGETVTPTVMGITIGGTNSQLAGSIGSEAVEATKALDITYTIGV